MTSRARAVTGLGRGIALTLLFMGAILVSSLPASAGPGVRFSRADIRIDQPLFLGNTYSLPTVTVSNAGDVTATYTMFVADKDGSAMSVPDEWLVAEPVTFELAPGESRNVESTLAIPHDARQGRYEGLIAAQITSGRTDAETGARVGAGAAAPLTFEVQGRTLLESWLGQMGRLWGDGGAWSYVFAAVVAVAALLSWVLRRFIFRIEHR